MVLAVSNANDVKIYSITSASRSALPDWIAKKHKKQLRYDEEYKRRIELIQDFEFPEASLRLKNTKDRKHIVATGTYKPQMRVFELADLAMKFDRHTDAENVQFQILSDDWTKIVMLQNDRSVEFHSQSGMHYRTRVPKFGRDLSYHYPSCDVLVVGASDEVYRLNLDLGRFMTPLKTDCPAINVCDINPAHQLWGFGGEDGRVEFWHPTEKKRIGVLDVAAGLTKALPMGALEAAPEITSLQFAQDGLKFAVGTSTGHVLLYDLRRPAPLLLKDHQYGYPIKSLHFHQASGNVLSADTKIVKIWNQDTGKILTNIEPDNDINDVLVHDDSGLIMAANEGTHIQSYYIPALGPAPRWCPFLDNLTEELEESAVSSVYDDYKFVTRKELNALCLDHLIGSNVIKPYMHGFFLDLRLYQQAKAISNPFQYDEFKKQQIQAKIEKERSTRISAIKKLPKVNKALAEKLLADKDDETERKKNGRQKKKDAMKPQGGTAENPMGDERFKTLFEDEDFEVDEDSLAYKLHHPSLFQHPKRGQSDDDDSDGDSDTKEQKKQPTRKVVHPLLQRAAAATKKTEAFAERLSKVVPQNARVSKKGGNVNVTFHKKTRQPQQERQNDSQEKRRKRGVGSLRLRR